MKTWLTADWHIGDTRQALMGRPITDPRWALRTLIENHNKLVSPNDLVYVVGDVFNKDVDLNVWIKYLKHFNGNKILIRGNHDRPYSDEVFEPYFETIIQDGSGIELEYDNIPLYVTHYPSLGKQDRFNLVGHIHGAWKYQLNSFNVGVDVNHFYPVDIETIPFHLNAITNFYDRDVWVAYNEINSSYFDKRGRKTAYFNGENRVE